MSFLIIFHKKAELELLESFDWYSKRSVLAGEKFSIDISNGVDSIQLNPLLYPIVYGAKRRFNLNNFPFSIIYSIRKKTIFILSVFHHSRNPKIWKHR
ncbi:MAG: hypothetical protein COB73_07310 [Flavobacteriaceae bacterium]|nr:MAG: hypothetical protein COB73_07310 [Flavobacteriaceae bacterium]